MINNPESQVFSACKGVFQGGGCKAVAYIGAYKEALEQGVIFSEVSGSSGGSIIAALIAAGATPQEMEQIIKEFDVKKIRSQSLLFKAIYLFLNRIPKKIESIIAFPTRHSEVKWQTWHFLVEGLHLSRYGYIYRTDTFERYVDRILRKVLKQKGTVKFSDLKIPLTVVTSDIRSHNYKVFSTWSDPDMSVAHAVVASAAIPGYFKPVDDLYVDGCIVSNLPVFSVVKDSVYDRVLTFTTDSRSPRSVGDLDTLEVVKQVAETIAQGGVDIQLASLPSSYNIRIPTEDFDILEYSILSNDKKREYVMQLGIDAMRRFLENKENHRNNQFDNNIFAADTDPRMQVSYLSRGPLQSVIVVSPNTQWMETQFPLIVRWHNQGSRIQIYCQPADDGDTDENDRRRMLNQLGCEISCAPHLPVQGYFFSYDDNQYSCLIAQEGEDFSGARVYSHSSDQFLIHSAIERMYRATYTHDPQLVPLNSPLQLEPESPQEQIGTITSEGGKYAGVEAEVLSLPLSRLSFSSRYVSGYKYQNLHYLYEMYQQAHVAPFSSARLRSGNIIFSLLAPLAIEKDGEYIVIDGATRVIYAHRRSIPTMEVIILKTDKPEDLEAKYHVSDLILTSKDHQLYGKL